MLDKFRETAITWDKATRRIYSPITANASDSNGRKLNIQVVNSGQVENLTGATLHLYWETKDKTQHGLDAFTASDISKGEFELFYTTGMLSNVGELNATLVLVDSTGKVVSDWFKITVTRGINEDAIESENSFSSLTQALIDISDLEQNYAPRLNDLTAQLQQTEQNINAQLADIGLNIKKYENLVVDDDWTNAIQTAINSFGDVGGTLFFPEGLYKVSSSIIFPSISNDPLVLKPITILGINGHSAGGTTTSYLRGLTAFHYVGEGALFELRSGTEALTSGMLTFRNFSAYGSNKIGSYGVNGYNTVGAIYENLSFKSFDIGILTSYYLYYSVFDNVTCANNLNYGASLGLVNGTTFRNCHFSKNEKSGIRLEFSGSVVNFDTCWFELNEEYGIYSLNTQQLNTFGCYFENNKIASIRFTKYEDTDLATLNSVSCFYNINTEAVCGIRHEGNVNINLSNTTVTSLVEGKRLVDVHSSGSANVYSYGFVSTRNAVEIASPNRLKVDIGNLHKDYNEFRIKSKMSENIEFSSARGILFYSGLEDSQTTGVLADFPNISTATAKLNMFRNTNTTGEKSLNMYAGDGTSQRTIFFDAGLGIATFKGGIGVGNSTDGDVTTTAKTKKMQVFNEFGAPIGYVQVYQG